MSTHEKGEISKETQAKLDRIRREQEGVLFEPLEIPLNQTQIDSDPKKYSSYLEALKEARRLQRERRAIGGDTSGKEGQ